jgi:hypothetical protein
MYKGRSAQEELGLEGGVDRRSAKECASLWVQVSGCHPLVRIFLGCYVLWFDSLVAIIWFTFSGSKVVVGFMISSSRTMLSATQCAQK